MQARRTHVLLKSHFLGYTNDADVKAKAFLTPRRELFFYPFRKFSTVLKSYAEFVGWERPISEILSAVDRHFDNGTTVAGCIHGHASRWLARDVHFVDSDRLGQNTELGAEQIGRLIDISPVPLIRRLPRRKISPGKFGELFERLSGRESTEVLVRPRLAWRDDDEQLDVDRRFEDLYGEMSRRRIN